MKLSRSHDLRSRFSKLIQTISPLNVQITCLSCWLEIANTSFPVLLFNVVFFFLIKMALRLSSFSFFIELSQSHDLRSRFFKLIQTIPPFNVQITCLPCWLEIAHTNFLFIFLPSFVLPYLIGQKINNNVLFFLDKFFFLYIYISHHDNMRKNIHVCYCCLSLYPYELNKAHLF